MALTMLVYHDLSYMKVELLDMNRKNYKASLIKSSNQIKQFISSIHSKRYINHDTNISYLKVKRNYMASLIELVITVFCLISAPPLISAPFFLIANYKELKEKSEISYQ